MQLTCVWTEVFLPLSCLSNLRITNLVQLLVLTYFFLLFSFVFGTSFLGVSFFSNISKALSAQERKGEGMVLDVNNNDSITNLIKAINEKDIQIRSCEQAIYNQKIELDDLRLYVRRDQRRY